MSINPAQEIVSPVCTYNDWDPLEEVIVGDVVGAHTADSDAIITSIYPPHLHPEMVGAKGQPVDSELIKLAKDQVENFVQILEGEGVKVRRPRQMPFGHPHQTPFWSSSNGISIANPRDLLLIIGNQIIETPSAWRNRYFETYCYRHLLKEYWDAGARWVSAPKPFLTDESFNWKCSRKMQGPPEEWPITEAEPLFDAADFVRCGKDLFVTRSFCTNLSGIDWLRRHLGDEFRIHEIVSHCATPVHIDTTFVPLAPGKALVNPKFAPVLPDILRKWDILYSPEPVVSPGLDRWGRYFTSSYWLTMNLFSLDSERLFVDPLQTELIKKLKDWGFKPILMPFQNYFPLGGGVHCSTLDVRRRGRLQSYF